MNRKKLCVALLVMVSFVVVTAIVKSRVGELARTIESLEEQIVDLQIQNEELNAKVDENDKTFELFTRLSQTVHRLALGRVTGNTNSVERLLAANYSLEKKDGVIYIVDKETGYDIEYYNPSKQPLYPGYIYLYVYNDKEEEFFIKTFEYHGYDGGGSYHWGITFKYIDDSWKIVDISLDA